MKIGVSGAFMGGVLFICAWFGCWTQRRCSIGRLLNWLVASVPYPNMLSLSV